MPAPAGTQIAFFASSDALGWEGPSRLMGTYKLYLMSVGELQPEPILDGIYDAHRVAGHQTAGGTCGDLVTGAAGLGQPS